MIRSLLTLFALLSFSILARAQQDYLWPTDASHRLTSTFGETRSAHFHAGLDIKTWGREGYKVFASRKGSLYRLRVTERGYGKVVYLKHPDSTYSVYAHLQRFNNKLQAIADSIRLNDYSFEMDALLDTMNIEIEQGEIIGYSGSTGIGPPHLHFELRDSLDNPFNALSTNLEVEDDLPPVFSSLLIEPLEQESRVSRRPVSKVMYPSAFGSNNTYYFGEVFINGEIGIAANVYDEANGVINKYAAYSLTLLKERDTLFHEQLDRFRYDQESEMFLDRAAPHGSSRRGYQRLFAKDGHDNPFYVKVLPGSEISIGDTAQTFTIIAEDYFGNAARAFISFRSNDSEAASGNVSFERPLHEWYWSENWISPDLINILDLQKPPVPFQKIDDNQWFLDAVNQPKTNFVRVLPDKQINTISPGKKLLLKFNEGSFYDTLSVASSFSLKDDEISVSIQPGSLPVKSQFKFEFFLGELYEAGLNYRLFEVDSDKNELSYVKSDLIGRTVHASLSALGEFYIVADNEPPSVSNFKIFKTDYGQWLATVSVTDELSGIDSKSAKFYVNGVRGIAEYDYEEEILIYYLPGFIPKNNNEAKITLGDNAGNSIITSFDTSR